MTSPLFYLWFLGWPAAGVIAGVAGLRSEWFRWVLSAIGGIYSLLFLIYGLFRGGVNDCVGSGSSYVCHPTPLLADIGWDGVLFIAAVTLLTLAPLVAAWLGMRWPSIVAAVVLILMLPFFLIGLSLSMPAISAVIAAAVAGPPRPWHGPADASVSQSR